MPEFETVTIYGKPDRQDPSEAEPPLPDPAEPHHIQQSELKYSVSVDRSAWFIRFYLWLWNGDVNSITFCKLFWSYVFALPYLLIDAVFSLGWGAGRLLLLGGRTSTIPVKVLMRGVRRFRKQQQSLRQEQTKALQQRRAEKRAVQLQARAQRIETIETHGAAAVLRLRSIKEAALKIVERTVMGSARGLGLVIRHAILTLLWPLKLTVLAGRGIINSRALHSRAATFAMLSIAGALSLVAAGFLTLVAIQLVPPAVSACANAFAAVAVAIPTLIAGLAHTIWRIQPLFWGIVGLMAAATAGSLIAIAVTTGVALWLVRVLEVALGPAAERSLDVLERAFFETAKPVARALETTGAGGAVAAEHIGRGFKGFRRMMFLGYYAVKTSTCPRIEVKDD